MILTALTPNEGCPRPSYLGRTVGTRDCWIDLNFLASKDIQEIHQKISLPSAELRHVEVGERDGATVIAAMIRMEWLRSTYPEAIASWEDQFSTLETIAETIGTR